MRSTSLVSCWAVIALLTTASGGQPSLAQEHDVPTFTVDPSWPDLPNNWVLGQVASVTTDGGNHIWVLHRPRTVPDEDQANAAPPVLEFDDAGTFIQAWGGPATDYDWPANEHGIHVDYRGHVWVVGNGNQNNSGEPSDDMLLKFTAEGELLLQVGGSGQSSGNTDTRNLKRPAESFVHEATNEVFVADGDGNRRVIVLDADTGAFKRMWGGFGNAPLEMHRPTATTVAADPSTLPPCTTASRSRRTG